MTSNSILTAAPSVRRIVHPNYPNPFDFPAGTPDEEVKQHFAQLQSARDYQELGPAAAIGRLLATAQNAITEKPAREVGPQVLRNVSAWGLTPGEVTNTFEALSNRQLQQQEQEQRRVEALANRQAQLQQMQQELQMVAEEHKFNQQMKAMEYEARQQEEQRKTELQAERDAKLQEGRIALEETKAGLKPPKLVWAKDPATGLTTLTEERVGLEKGDPASMSPQEQSAKMFSIAQDLMDNVLVNDAGEEVPVDFNMAASAAESIVKTGKVNFDFPGYVMVKKPKDPDLVSQTDASGKTVQVPAGVGVVTKEPPAESPKEARQRVKELRDIAKADLDDAKAEAQTIQTDPEQPDYDPEAAKKAKEAVQAAMDEYKVYNDAYKKALKGEEPASVKQPGAANAAPEQEVDDLSGVPDGTVVMNNETGKKEIVYNGVAIPMTE